MSEISKPTERTYWVARSEDGKILHSGYTDPGQVTTTGQAVLAFGNRTVQVDEIAKYRGNPDAYNYEWDGKQWAFAGENLVYIPASAAIAEDLSRALFALVYGKDKAGLYAGVIPHPSGKGHTLLQCRSTDKIPVALGADPQPLVDVLQIPVDDGTLTKAELDGIVGAVSALAGKTVDLVDFVPPSWQPYLMTRAQAEAAGYFPDA